MPKGCPSILPSPSITCRARALGVQGLCCQGSLLGTSSGSFQLQGEMGMGGVEEGAPAHSGCTPNSPAVPHSPDELRLWLLAGLLLPEATPRRWLHPREMVVRGNMRLKGGGDPPRTREGWWGAVSTAYFLSSASLCRCCRALTNAVGSKRGGREPGRGRQRWGSG